MVMKFKTGIAANFGLLLLFLLVETSDATSFTLTAIPTAWAV
jgi:hypothetical protein